MGGMRGKIEGHFARRTLHMPGGLTPLNLSFALAPETAVNPRGVTGR